MSSNLETISIHGQDAAVRIAGSGPAVVLVHGLASSSDTWIPTIDRLAETHRIIAPDLPGHGRSAKPRGDYSLGAYANFLRDLLANLECPRATIVGHSFGGGIAMQFAYQHPDIAERLVLVSSGGLGDEVSWLLRTLSAPGVEHLLGLATLPLVRNAADRTGTLLTKVGLQPSEQANEIHNAYTSLASAEARSALVHTIRSVIDLQGQRVSASDRIHVAGDLPTLIVWGSRDRIIPVTHAHDAHELIPGSRLELFEQAGHFPHTEEPARFGAALEEHLTRPLPVGSAQSQKQYRPR
jgi:pimeloyl-ACP methyl ester carboxylesterase